MNNQSHKLISSWGSISGSSQNGALSTRSSTFMGVNAAIWTVLGILFLLQINIYFYTSLTTEITAIVAGITIFGVASALITQKMLIDLEKTGQVVTTLKTVLISLGAAVVIISVLLSVKLGDFSVGIKNGFLSSLALGVPASVVTRFLLMKKWENKNKKLILQDKYRFYILPEPPVNSTLTQTAFNQTWHKDEKLT